MVESGVYVICSILDNRVYVGSSCNIPRRFRCHISSLLRGTHHNKHLQRFVDKYGIKSLRFGILEVCVPKKHVLINREQYYLDLLKPKFNLAIVADSPMSGRKGEIKRPDVVERNKLAKGKKRGPLPISTRLRIGSSNRGKIISEQCRKKISAAKKGKRRPDLSELNRSRTADFWEAVASKNRGRKRTKETKSKISEAMKMSWKRKNK